MAKQLTPQYREGFVFHVIDKAFPGLRHKNPTAFGQDVRLAYLWSLKHPHASALDPLDIKPHGQFKNEQQALAASAHYFDAPRQAKLHDLMAGGFTDMAAIQLGVNYDHGPQMPSKVDSHGNLASHNVTPSTGTLLKDTAKALPGAVAHDTAVVAGGLGDVLKSPIVWIVLIVVLVLVVKK